MQLPARIGKYELLEFLGGGMSHVYRAKDSLIDRTVAVKILTEAGVRDPEAKARFLHEARLAGNIDHDNIVNIFDYGVEGAQPYIVMEFIRGENLKDAIRNNHTGDLRNKLRIAHEIAAALDYVHSKKIIHRDIKPDNIHLETSGRVKLMDFGIAKSEGVAITKLGFTLGTPYYMAPEQIMGQPVTPLVDIYAFGILLYELLTGRKPIAAESIEQIFHLILHQPLSVQPLRDAGVPPAVEAVVMRCAAKNAGERYPGFAEVDRDITRLMASPELLSQYPTGAMQAPPMHPGSRSGSQQVPVVQAAAAMQPRGVTGMQPMTAMGTQPQQAAVPQPLPLRPMAQPAQPQYGGMAGMTAQQQQPLYGQPPVASRPAAPVPAGLPGVLGKLPPALQTQQALMVITAMVVLFLLGGVYAVATLFLK